MFGGNRDSVAAVEMRARHQRAGYLWKLPMSKSTSDKWQRRTFVAKDGFLLYYSTDVSPDSPHFNTKAKGIIPLGGCKVEEVERGPKGGKFGLKVTHPDFLTGRVLMLAAETKADQQAWLVALNDCSRVTMENAKLGDAMIEKLRVAGTAAEKEKSDAIEQLQAQALALKVEQEEKLKLQEDSEGLKRAAVEAEERARAKEAEMAEAMAAAMAEVESRRTALIAEAQSLQAAIDEKNSKLASSLAEYEELKAILAKGEGGAGGEGGSSSGDLVARARALEDTKLQLEHEKMALERSVRDLSSSTAQLQSTLRSAEEQRRQMEAQLRDVANAEADLHQERQLRKRLERKLQIAEDSLKRLDDALRRSGIKLDVDIVADVKTLKSFFEERVDEVRRDAHRFDIMKKALKAKRQYLVATAKTDVDEGAAETIRDFEAKAAAADETWDTEEAAPVDTPLVAPAAAAPPAQAVVAAATSKGPARALSMRLNAADIAAVAAAAAAPAPGGGAGKDDDWDDESVGPADTDEEDNAEAAPLPANWTRQTDAEGDVWYYNSVTGATSWVRPNPDGSVPAQ